MVSQEHFKKLGLPRVGFPAFRNLYCNNTNMYYTANFEAKLSNTCTTQCYTANFEAKLSSIVITALPMRPATPDLREIMGHGYTSFNENKSSYRYHVS